MILRCDTKEYEDLGLVEYRCRRRNKHIRIRLEGRALLVSYPPRIRLSQVESVLLANRDFFARKIRERAQKPVATPRMSPDDIREAGDRIRNRCRTLAEQHQFEYRQITIRTQKTRWGSCSSKGNLSLNAKLIYLPEDLMDYVILHELCHTRHLNHGPQFWEELSRILGHPARRFRPLMRQYGYLLN